MTIFPEIFENTRSLAPPPPFSITTYSAINPPISAKRKFRTETIRIGKYENATNESIISFN